MGYAQIKKRLLEPFFCVFSLLMLNKIYHFNLIFQLSEKELKNIAKYGIFCDLFFRLVNKKHTKSKLFSQGKDEDFILLYILPARALGKACF